MTGAYPIFQPSEPHDSFLKNFPAQPLAPKPEFFLSHATADTAHLALVCPQIEAMGISLYLAEHDPKAGTLLSQKVIDAILRCQAVVVLITTTSLNSAFVQQEVGIAHQAGKLIVPIVEKGIDTRQLGILQGIEHIPFDLSEPAETMAKITANLQPLVVNHITAMNVSVSVTQSSMDPAAAFMLVGLGAILALLVIAVLSSQGE